MKPAGRLRCLPAGTLFIFPFQKNICSLPGDTTHVHDAERRLFTKIKRHENELRKLNGNRNGKTDEKRL